MGSLWIHFWLLPALLADLVAIESDPPDPDLAQIAIESCSDALGAGRCQAAGASDAAATWFVRVTWQPPERRRARIEIRHGARDATPASVRVVEFSAADDLAQRNRAIGLIIAAYVIEQSPPAPATEVAPAPAPEPAPRPAAFAPPAAEEEPAAPATAETRAPAWGADLALLAGPGLDRGAPRLGLMLRGFARPLQLPLAALLALRLARRAGDTAVLWIGGAAGLALRLRTPLSALAFELRGEFALERLHAEASDELSGMQQSGGAYRYGGRFGLEAHVALGARFALFAGGELSALVPNVYLDVGGEPAGRDRTIGWGGLAGVRLAD